MENKVIKKIDKVCSCCGKAIKILIYSKSNYMGGHYFGKIPLCTNKEIKKSIECGFRREKFGNTEIRVFKKDPKAYAEAEYWECPKCYKD